MELLCEKETDKLRAIAKTVREDIVNIINHSHMGHPGSSLSMVEILVALYFRIMQIDPQKPDWPDRDRFILSKGHGSPALYSILAHRGYFSTDELQTFRQYQSMLTAYPDMLTPGIDMESGSLGHGLSAGVGMAMSGRVHKQDYNIYVLLGDGELQEGMVWEAAMCAAHHKLDCLIAIVDWNKLQINGTIDEVMSIQPLEDKWKSFGWNVLNVDGHNLEAVLEALNIARAHEGSPTVIIADTVKGKGISFMENNRCWHRRDITDEQKIQALKEIAYGG